MGLEVEMLVGDLGFEMRRVSVACRQLLKQVTLCMEVSTALLPSKKRPVFGAVFYNQALCEHGKTGVEMLEILWKAYSDDAMKQQLSCGTGGSGKVRSPSTTTARDPQKCVVHSEFVPRDEQSTKRFTVKC